MAVRHLNTAKLYFGGDIAKGVAEDNARRYKSHATWCPKLGLSRYVSLWEASRNLGFFG